MPRAKSKPITPNWAVELRSVMTAKTRQPKGEGWMTTDQICESLDISRGTALQYLRRGMESGQIEMYRGTAISSAGIRIQSWYRPVMVKKRIT
jgi:hypothetical protein